MEYQYPDEYYELTEELQRLYEADTQNKERLIEEGRGKLDGEIDDLLSVVDQMDDTAHEGRTFKRLLYKRLQNLKKINNPARFQENGESR